MLDIFHSMCNGLIYSNILYGFQFLVKDINRFHDNLHFLYNNLQFNIWNLKVSC